MFSGLHYQTRVQMFSGLSDQTTVQMFSGIHYQTRAQMFSGLHYQTRVQMFSGLRYQTRVQMFSGLSDQTRAQMFPLSPQKQEGPAPLQAQRLPPGGSRWGFGILVVTSCVGAVLAAAMTITCLRRHAHRLAARKLGLGPEGGSFTHQEYQV